MTREIRCNVLHSPTPTPPHNSRAHRAPSSLIPQFLIMNSTADKRQSGLKERDVAQDKRYLLLNISNYIVVL